MVAALTAIQHSMRYTIALQVIEQYAGPEVPIFKVLVVSCVGPCQLCALLCPLGQACLLGVSVHVLGVG